MDWGNTGADSINRTEVGSKRSVSFLLMLVKEIEITNQYIGDLCLRSSLYTDHNHGQDINRLIPSNISTHRRVDQNR